MEPKTPIIIGVGDIVNRSRRVEDAIEPLQLIIEAIQKALKDSGIDTSAAKSLQTDIDSIDVVKSWTWPYPDLAGLLAKKLDAKPQRKHNSEHGGNQPALLLDEAARRISKGESKVAIIIGCEALASLSACAAAKKLPPPNWTPLDQDINGVFSPSTREIASNLGAKHHIGNPFHIYPLYENGFRAHRNQSIKANHAESADLYAEFAAVAVRNEYAWSKGETRERIGTVDGRNRMINFPYPLLMNALNTVNLAAACILTSTEYAKQIGVPEEKWIYPLGGAGTSDSSDFWERPAYWWSPSISRSLDAGLQVSGLKKEDIDFYDFYSCFPIVPKLACAHLDLPITKGSKPITLLGGLTSFGGAGNNYSMHAITEMTRQLRQNTPNKRTGLILANGGSLTYQHVVCLSRNPRSSPYPPTPPLPGLVEDVQIPAVQESIQSGEAEEAGVETYTVEFGKDGRPVRGHVVGRLKRNGFRFIANHGDEGTLQGLASWDVESIGRQGWVWKAKEDGRNLFSFLEGSGAKL